MSELARSRAIATTLTIAGGGLAVFGFAGCGSESLSGNVANCEHGGNPVAQEYSSNLRPGAKMQPERPLTTDNDGQPDQEDFAIISAGQGDFIVTTPDGSAVSTGEALSAFDSSNTVAVAYGAALYTIQGTRGDHGTTSLTVNVRCSQTA